MCDRTGVSSFNDTDTLVLRHHVVGTAKGLIYENFDSGSPYWNTAGALEHSLASVSREVLQLGEFTIPCDS